MHTHRQTHTYIHTIEFWNNIEFVVIIVNSNAILTTFSLCLFIHTYIYISIRSYRRFLIIIKIIYTLLIWICIFIHIIIIHTCPSIWKFDWISCEKSGWRPKLVDFSQLKLVLIWDVFDFQQPFFFHMGSNLRLFIDYRFKKLWTNLKENWTICSYFLKPLEKRVIN